MKLLAVLSVFTLVAVTLASAIPKPASDDENGVNGNGKHKNRVMEKDLSEQNHVLSDEDHDGDHNPEYDHEAFLGKDEARTFDQLTPEESQDRLGLIYNKIDKDGNEKVSEEELKQWIKYVQNRYILQDTERQWKEHNLQEEDTHLTWESYKERTYGYLDNEDKDDDEEEEDDRFSYKEMLKRDERRWKAADKDEDNKLSKEEFINFLHPEDAEHMRDIVVQETLEDIDKDKDGYISLEEYIADMWPDREDEDEPDWVKTEREQFAEFRDKNTDGKMDHEEVKEWIIPSDYDHSEAEAKHLIYESDEDRDGELTKDEVLNKYDLFVGSQATDFGEALARHDEF